MELSRCSRKFHKLLERESLKASKELYKRRSSVQACNLKEATKENHKGVKPL